MLIGFTIARDPNEKLISPEGDVKPGDRLNCTINYENEGEGKCHLTINW